MKPQHILNIQLLRGLAALLVVCAHTVGTAAHYQFPVEKWQGVMLWGASGVDIFFVISGFIMVYITHQKMPSSAQFLRARIKRIVPLYWLLTAVVALLLMCAPHIFKTTSMSLNQIAASFLFVSQFTHNGAFPLIGAGWSLEYEMLFYLCFAISLHSQTTSRRIAITSLLLLLIASFSNYSLIVIELILGMLIGYFYLRKKQSIKIKYPLKKTLCAIIFLSASLCFFYLLTLYEVTLESRLFFFGIPACVLVIAGLYLPPYKNVLGMLLGNTSYSIYLIQFFTIPIFYKVVSYVQTPDFVLQAYGLAIFCVIFTVISGILTHYILEKPLNNITIKPT